jgi:pilus assembly protein Flp/PilA
MNAFGRLMSATSGASSAEYALLLAIMGAGIAAAALLLGGSIAQSLEASGTTVQSCGGAC